MVSKVNPLYAKIFYLFKEINVIFLHVNRLVNLL